MAPTVPTCSFATDSALIALARQAPAGRRRIRDTHLAASRAFAHITPVLKLPVLPALAVLAIVLDMVFVASWSGWSNDPEREIATDG